MHPERPLPEELLVRPPLDDGGVDPGQSELAGQHQPRRTRPHDDDIRIRHGHTLPLRRGLRRLRINRRAPILDLNCFVPISQLCREARLAHGGRARRRISRRSVRRFVPPPDLLPYRRTVEFTETTVPAGLLRSHSTKAGTWGLIHVLDGRLAYRITDPRRPASESVLTADGEPGVVEPTILHEVEPLGAVRFYVEFLKTPDAGD
jgi:tellurite resistance-related uncharacterized protein